MRAMTVAVFWSLIHLGAVAQNCPLGMGTLPAGMASAGGNTCIASPMVAFLVCANQLGNGRIEISSETLITRSETIEVTGSADGGNLALKLNLGGGYKAANAVTDIQKASQKLDSGLATVCRDMALAPSTPPKEAPWRPNQRVPPRSASLHFTGPMGPLEPGISYNQGDIYDSPSNTAVECSRLCYDDNRCLAVTWIESQKRCWVKSFYTGNVGYSRDMTSARKLIAR